MKITDKNETKVEKIEKVIGGWLVSIRDDKQAVDAAKNFVVLDPMVYMY